MLLKKQLMVIPDWCGSVGQALSCEPKGHWSTSQGEHMFGVQDRSGWGHSRSNQSMFLSDFDVALPLSPSLPLSLKMHK